MVADSIEHCEQTLMFTDIVGYSRLMGRNESLAVEMLGDYRRILLSHIEQQGGQLVEFVGDAIFARFNTAPSAVAAAIAIQQHLLAFNEARDKKLPRLQTRIGLHKGEVMLRDGAVFGDSVNIAARLEPLAVADGICISQTVYEEIRLTLSSPAKRLGLQSLKNIQQKIRVYLIKPVGIGWRDHLHYFLRGLNKNIVAYRYPLTACLLAIIAAGVYFIPRWLVPGYAANYVEIADFKNLMNEKGDADYFSAGITEAVRSQLADMRDVYIVDAKEGIHAPIRLEGSVQKLGDNLRIAYRLFRRRDNVQIAGGKLDGTYQDIFILQDRLVGEIARYLSDEFDLQNFRPAPLKLTNDITAYDFYLRGLEFLNRPASQDNIDRSIQLFSTALIHDDNFSLALYGLCRGYRKKFILTNLVHWLDKAKEACSLSLEKDKYSSKTYLAIGALYKERGQYLDAISWINKAVLLDGDNALVLVSLASVYDALGQDEEAEKIYTELLKKYHANWLSYSSYGFFLTKKKRYKEAIFLYKKAVEITPENSILFNNIAANYMYLNDFKSAAVNLEKAAMIDPNGIVLGNSGSMYFLSGQFDKSLVMYQEAIKLEPENYEWLVNIADLYFYGFHEREKAVLFYKRAAIYAAKNGEKGVIAKNYQYLARIYAELGDVGKAEEFIGVADSLDVGSIDSSYAHLKISLKKNDVKSILFYFKKLINDGYSLNLIKSDPGLADLHKNHHHIYSEN